MKKYFLIAAVALPIVVLLGLMLSKQLRLAQGSQVILPIAGFDPRDLLTGHYLTYRINYGVSADCSRWQGEGQKLYACLYKESGAEELYRARFISQNDSLDTSCGLFIAGRCENGRFAAGIEKFSIPEQYAKPLDKAVRAGKGKIVLKVSGSGAAAIQDLLIDGKSWREYKE
jgi:uncharacterized membrane-anchored protein